jgi:hypothetical protein
LKVQFLRTNAVDMILRRLIVECDEFHWAVAWGSMTSTAKTLFRYPEKFRNVTFGVAFSHTDPKVVDALQNIEGARVATKFAGGTFHPKVYGFRSGSQAEAVVGSANFTFGGLDNNWEAAIYVTGNAADPFFLDVFKFTEDSAKLGEAVTPTFALAYGASCKRASRMIKPPRDPMEGLGAISPAGFASPLVSMSWQAYAAAVRASAHHNVDESLNLLRIAQQWFASTKSFARLTAEQRKAIAGVIGKKQRKLSLDLDRDWGWFGSMKGMGDFANRVKENDRSLARALDCIPGKGEVTRSHFDLFIRHFKKAFDGSTRIGGVPTATRLLAMKRPDTFVCICNPNIVEASARMGFARTTLNLEDYWEKVIEVVRLSDWYNVEKPDNADGELWENRVAMLDAIFYAP